MDKKRQLQFNLNNFLLSISMALDAVESDICKTSLGHSKRVAYLTIRLAQEYNYEHEGLNDICAYSLFHSIALKQTKEKNEEYCLLAQEYANSFPFLLKEENILKYQCEYYNGSGVFGLKEDEIPLFSQFLSFADLIDTKFDLSDASFDNRMRIVEFLNENENVLFSSDMVECFTQFSQNISFWLDLQNEHELLTFIFSNLRDYSIALDFEEVLKMTSIFTKIVNSDLSLIENASLMSDFYEFEHKDKQTFLIAASLANIGKLFILDEILNKKEDLSEHEYEIVKSYPYYTKKVLSNILGFSDIATWASKVQEKPNACGYPFGLNAKDLSLKDRLLAVLNAYTALTSDKSYRSAYSKEEAINILKDISNKDGSLDLSIINDLEKALA